ncbi:MAG TPA: hypothetical protein PLH91_14175 [Tenuifilaceae bacterium]|nr:hypothetical protein [Tenuifilaceae bacterium]HOZ15416.1 hypothetical protein [Tenuifilaceae bacterium]HPI46378.1 hypothetical protein [Tenuifilaceae bacterium]HPN23234.1 hypothetical protein [Tenuifilaceae bacterium]HPV56663.1 hypothetical protein [Tenuifilaceae bacterium]
MCHIKRDARKSDGLKDFRIVASQWIHIGMEKMNTNPPLNLFTD